jgi:hypothetical protein
MYNSKHPHTWDESLPYVQHSYNRALHSSIGHNPFKWGWDSNHWAPWMLHYPWRPPRLTRPLLHQNLTKPPDSLSGSSISTNRFRIFYRSLIPSTSNAMINIECHISFMWTTKFGCVCRKNALQSPIRNFGHSVMGRTPSPRLWVTMFLSSTFPPSLVCIKCSTWLSFDHISHHYWTPQR